MAAAADDQEESPDCDDRRSFVGKSVSSAAAVALTTALPLTAPDPPTPPP